MQGPGMLCSACGGRAGEGARSLLYVLGREESCWSRRTDEAEEEQCGGQLATQKWRLVVRYPSLKTEHKPPPNLESPQFLMCVICACVSLSAGDPRYELLEASHPIQVGTPGAVQGAQGGSEKSKVPSDLPAPSGHGRLCRDPAETQSRAEEACPGSWLWAVGGVHACLCAPACVCV